MLALKQGLSLPTIKAVGSGGAGFENLYSLDFAGGTDILDWGDKDVFTPNDSGANRGFSLSYWIKTTSTRQNTIQKYSPVAQVEYVVNIGIGGALKVTLYGNSDINIIQKLITDSSAGNFINLADGNWHHIIITFDLADATTSIQFWIDGVNFNAASGATYTSTGTWAAVGNSTAPMTMSNSSFTGNMDEYAIFDTVLSASDVASIYNSGVPNDISGINYLIGWWRNGDPTGTGAYPTIVDQSTNSNDGTMTHMASGDIVTDVP